MAGLNFFISSTCYDLGEVRNQLKNFINDLGHEAILSEHNDVLYDFKYHTHVSCVNEVENSDILILIVGNRFGGEAIFDTYDLIDVDKLNEVMLEKFDFDDFRKKVENGFNSKLDEKSNNNDVENSENSEKGIELNKVYLSITHMEVLKAISEGIPIYVFVNKTILDYQHVYKETYKSLGDQKENIKYLCFPGFKKLEHAISLFNFIDLLQNRKIGNSIFPFNTFKDVELTLRKQLANKFKKLLLDERISIQKNVVYESLSIQFNELKMAVLGSMTSVKKKNLARNIIKLSPAVRIYIYLLKKAGKNVDYLYNTSELNWKSFLNYLAAKMLEKNDIDEINEKYTPYNLGRASHLDKCWFSIDNGLIVIDRRYLENLESDLEDFSDLELSDRKDLVQILTEEGRLYGNPRVQFINTKVA